MTVTKQLTGGKVYLGSHCRGFHLRSVGVVALGPVVRWWPTWWNYEVKEAAHLTVAWEREGGRARLSKPLSRAHPQ